MPIFSLRFKFREMELCSRDRKWPDAYRSQHKPATSVIWSRVLGVQEGWCCGPIEFDCYTAVYLPMHLCSILSRRHPRAYEWRAETRARLSSPIPCRDNVLAIKEIYSYSDKAGNGNQVKQGTISTCALCMAAAFLLLPFLLPHCSHSPKEMSGLHFVCAGSSAFTFQQWYFPGQSLPKHFPGISVVRDRELDLWSDLQLSCLLLPLSSWGVPDRRWDADVWRHISLACEAGLEVLVQPNFSNEKSILHTKKVCNARVFTKWRLERILKSKQFKEQSSSFSSEEFNPQASRFSWQRDWKIWCVQTCIRYIE